MQKICHCFLFCRLGVLNKQTIEFSLDVTEENTESHTMLTLLIKIIDISKLNNTSFFTLSDKQQSEFCINLIFLHFILFFFLYVHTFFKI